MKQVEEQTIYKKLILMKWWTWMDKNWKLTKKKRICKNFCKKDGRSCLKCKN
jgi:hypothetical protein